MVPHDRMGALWTGPHDLFILIKSFLHGGFETLDRIHFFLKALHVAHGLQAHIGALEPPQADPIATVAGGQFITEGHGRGQISFLSIEQNHEIQGFSKLDHIASGLLCHTSQLIGGRNVRNEAQAHHRLFHFRLRIASHMKEEKGHARPFFLLQLEANRHQGLLELASLKLSHLLPKASLMG